MHKKVVSKEILYIFALALDAAGGAFVIHSGFGVTPMSAFPLVLNDVFPSLSVGTMNFILQVAVLVLLLIYLNKFSMYYLMCFLGAFFYDAFLDLFLLFFRDLPTLFHFRVIYFLLNILLVGIAIGFYMRVTMPLMPFDVIVKELAIKFKISEGRMKIYVDIGFVVCAVIVGLTFFGEIRYIGLTTIILAFTIGLIADTTNRIFDRLFDYKCITKTGYKLECLTIENENLTINKNKD